MLERMTKRMVSFDAFPKGGFKFSLTLELPNILALTCAPSAKEYSKRNQRRRIGDTAFGHFPCVDSRWGGRGVSNDTATVRVRSRHREKQ